MQNVHRKRTVVVRFVDNIRQDEARKILRRKYGLAVVRWLRKTMAVVAVPEGEEARFIEVLKRDVIVRAVTMDERL
jgi:hypothetical protein